ncbi:uncharacterized protein BXZ73DRAFT_90390 [Epithele typhae]|uniref:uncharacterized protein n=1 Tax=Epithele typhae TaxID=378194 RepID=UPI0020084ABB|nr:uncharacterized protein BXZ73DRAFT_90390 [Epithele typhae]KAH9929536.1 hypothetical protein BXZ73DRAFT_90390 [Epithele typhae]
MSASPAPSPSSAPTGSTRHAAAAIDKQRAQLEKLLKDPAKPAHIPAPPKEKSVRAAREMMKNVQGSSAGAGSGEFHVYKASRRREYERLKVMDEQAQKEAEVADFEKKKRQWDEAAEAKTAKNRAKRQKKKERAKGKCPEKDQDGSHGTGRGGGGSGPSGDKSVDAPFKKRRLVSGKEMVFRRPGEEDSDEEDDDEGPMPAPSTGVDAIADAQPVAVIDAPRIIIHEDD